MFKNLTEKIKKTSNKNKIFLILTIIFIFMLILNFITPLIADDYSYAMMRDNTPIQNIYDIIINQIGHYFNWGGRTVAHTIAQIFLALLGKNIFNIFNSLVYVLLIYLIYKLAKPKDEDRPILLLVIHLFLWFVLPVFGQTCLWLIGSCNYLWTTLIILIFLNFYKNIDFKKNSIKKIFLMFILGLIAGWTNENTSFGLLVITLGILISTKISNKKEELPIWTISGFIGSLIGFLILILAPGNFLRNDEFANEYSIVATLIKRILDATKGITEYLFPLLLIVIILITILLYQKKKIKPIILLYLTGSFFTIYSMALSPTFPERAWFGVIIFMIIPIINLLYDILKLHKIFNFILTDLCIIFSIIFVTTYIEAFQDILKLKITWDARIEYIEYQKDNNILDIEVGGFYTENKYNPNYQLADLSEKSSDWPNADISDYFNITSLKKK